MKAYWQMIKGILLEQGRWRKRILLMILFFLFLLACFGIYHIRLKEVIEDSQNAMVQVTEHNKKYIYSETEDNWNHLYYLARRFQASSCNTVEELQELLASEAVLSDFQVVSLVTKEGMVYNNQRQVFDGNDRDYVKGLQKDNARIALYYDEEAFGYHFTQDMIAYGLGDINFEVEGITFVGIIGWRPIQPLREQILEHRSTDDIQIYVIDQNKRYVMKEFSDSKYKDVKMIQHAWNFETVKTPYSQQTLIEKIDKKESFFCDLETKNKVFTLYFSPVEETGWYLITEMSHQDIKQQTTRMAFFSIIIVAVSLLVISVAFVIIFLFMGKAIEAKTIAETRADFLNQMSHEIRTPLNGILGLVYLLERNGENKELRNQYVKKLESTSKYLLNLLNDVLDMSKLNQSNIELHMTEFSVVQLCEDVERMLKDPMEEKQLCYYSQFDFEKEFVMGDDTRIKQVLINIIANAIKYTNPKGCINFKGHQVLREGIWFSIFEISDTGIGMSEEFQKKIFEPFAQEGQNQEKSSSLKGTGLGMPISQKIVEQMGGSITVQSKLKEGSRFVITIPMEPVSEENEIAKLPKKATIHQEIAEQTTVLVAEDNELNAEILQAILQDNGLQVKMAKDGKEAVELFETSQEGEIKIILMDVQMPRMNGFEATEQIRGMDRGDAKSVLIYACTANTETKEKQHATAVGMNGFLTKPIDVNHLGRILEKEGLV